jgi:hypothetical protein
VPVVHDLVFFRLYWGEHVEVCGKFEGKVLKQRHNLGSRDIQELVY